MNEQCLAGNIQQKTIQKVFDQRSEFIIIGLTGSRKSKTSEIANILQSKFDELDLSSYHTALDYKSQKEYDMIYNFAKVHWKEFDVIRARDVIITYLLENNNSWKRFQNEIKIDLIKDVGFDRKIQFKISKLLKQFGNKSLNENEKSIKRYISEFQDKVINNGIMDALVDQNEFLINYIEKLKQRDSAVHKINTAQLYVYTKYILTIVGDTLEDCIDEDTYSELFQKYGNEIRFFGTIDMYQWRKKLENIEQISNFDYFYSIAKRTNTFIKLRRSPFQNSKSISVRIVIDSLKNTYEASFLKDRYSAYYTFSVLKDNKNVANSLDNQNKKEKLALFENLELIKKKFRLFIQLVNNKIEESATNIYIQEYIKCLQNPDSYLKFIFDKLESMEKERKMSIDWDKNLDLITDLFKDDISLKNLGINQNDINFFVEILKEPIRTFCLIADLVPFFLQDVQNSTQNGDVFFADIADQTSPSSLTYKVVKYISLIMHPGIVLPTPIERCMQVAYSSKVNSGCISRQVGAVVTDKEYNILSVAWNDPPKSEIPCIFRDLMDLQYPQNSEIYSDMELDRMSWFNKYIKDYDFSDNKKNEAILDGLKPCFCFKTIYSKLENKRDLAKSKAIHAEARAFYNSNIDKVTGGYLFTTSSSCAGCTLIAKEREISKIYYIEEYPDIAQEHVANCGDYNKRPKFEIFEGAIGLAYNKLYTSIIPLKDELQLRGIEQLHR